MHPEDVPLRNDLLDVDQGQYQPVGTEDRTIRQVHANADDLNSPRYSSNFLLPLPIDVPEPFSDCDTQGDFSMSFESTYIPEYIFSNQEAYLGNRDDEGEQLLHHDTDDEIANQYSYSPLSVPVNRTSLELPQAVTNTAHLYRNLQGRHTHGSFEHSQMFPNGIGQFSNDSVSRRTPNSQFPFQQRTSSQHHSQAFGRQEFNHSQSISCEYSADTNTYPNEDRVFSSVPDHAYNTIPSISLSDEPWSGQTLRQQGDHEYLLREKTDMLVRRSALATTSTDSNPDARSMPGNGAGYSISSLYPTDDDINNSRKVRDVCRPSETLFNGWTWSTANSTKQMSAVLDMTPALTEVNPEPYLNVGSGDFQDENTRHQPQRSQLARHVSHSNTTYLSVPGQDDDCSDRRSEASSTSGPLSDTILCEQCPSIFRGNYRNGNKARHMRLKHTSKSPAVYACDHCPIRKAFNRKDARLKHYRKYHPDLGLEPARPRRLSAISQTSSSSRANSVVQ